MDKDEALKKARNDFAKRIEVGDSDIEESVEDAEFPDMALGAATEGEMSGQMITPGWRIRLRSKGNELEYRANKHGVRLFDYGGKNYRL